MPKKAGSVFLAYVTEDGEIKVFDTVEVERMIRASEMIDGFSLALFLRARLAGIV